LFQQGQAKEISKILQCISDRDALESELKLQYKFSAQAKTNIKHLRAKFGTRLAMSLSAIDIDKYIERLLAEKCRPATCNGHTRWFQPPPVRFHLNSGDRREKLHKRPCSSGPPPTILQRWKGKDSR